MLHNRVLRLESSKARRKFPVDFSIGPFISCLSAFALCTFAPLLLRTFTLSHLLTFSPSHLHTFSHFLFYLGTANFGHLSDAPIEKSEVLAALKGRGSLEGISIEHFVNQDGVKSTFGVVTFAYPDDYADALQVSRLSNFAPTLLTT